ncbi:MAG: hypothetical protein IKU35_09755 [Bacteroidaceae bacterium]|nr:hypothetical protein [Bacteroidaceae bacterium]
MMILHGKIYAKAIVVTLLLCLGVTAMAQESHLTYFMQSSLQTTDGDNAPFWFTANRQGLSSVRCNSYFRRTGIEYGGTFKNNKFGYNAVADVVLSHNYNADFFVQQLYGELSWRWLRLSIGSKERFSETRTHLSQFAATAYAANRVNSLFPALHYEGGTMLSSGSMAYSGNSRPIPQVRIEVPEYTKISGTNGWLKMRGHIAYGRFTDDHFQEKFSRNNDITLYGKNILFHSKAGFIEIGNAEKFPLLFEGGLEMYTQFGGDIYTHGGGLKLSMPNTLADYWKAFIPLSGSDDTPEVEQTNISGNQIGSWHAAFTVPMKQMEVRVYGEHMFEDFSQLFFFEYQSDRHGDRNIIYYPWRDMMLGVRITNKSKKLPFISAIQYEFLTTKDQSGALYNDPSVNFPEQMDGADNYYNHGIYPGWHHWGMGIGNPLIVSPAYNDNGSLKFRSNRLVAHNVGMNGTLECIKVPIHYRLQYAYSENWGTYSNPFESKKYSTSLLGEFTYAPGKGKWLGSIAVAYDKSDYIGDNTGVMFTLTRVGEIFRKR